MNPRKMSENRRQLEAKIENCKKKGQIRRKEDGTLEVELGPELVELISFVLGLFGVPVPQRVIQAVVNLINMFLGDDD